jgi:hypothetical protein
MDGEPNSDQEPGGLYSLQKHAHDVVWRCAHVGEGWPWLLGLGCAERWRRDSEQRYTRPSRRVGSSARNKLERTFFALVRDGYLSRSKPWGGCWASCTNSSSARAVYAVGRCLMQVENFGWVSPRHRNAQHQDRPRSVTGKGKEGQHTCDNNLEQSNGTEGVIRKSPKYSWPNARRFCRSTIDLARSGQGRSKVGGEMGDAVYYIRESSKSSHLTFIHPEPSLLVLHSRPGAIRPPSARLQRVHA